MTVLMDPWREESRYRKWLPHEVEWIKAALTKDWRERYEDYQAIADMIGVSRELVRHKAKRIADKARKEAELANWEDSKRPYLAAAE